MLDKLVGANRTQVLSRIPHLEKLLDFDLQNAVSNVELLVVARKGKWIDTLAQSVGPQHVVSDVNGWDELYELDCKVIGLCW